MTPLIQLGVSRGAEMMCASSSPFLAAEVGPVPRQGGGALETRAVAW